MDRYEKMFTRRSNGLFQASYTKDGKRHYLYDRDAHRLFNRLTGATEEKPTTVRELAESWESVHREEIGDRTWNNYRPHLSRIVSAYGDMAVKDVTPLVVMSDVEQARAKRYSGTICRTILSIWTMMLTHAVVLGLIIHNPAREIRLPKGLPSSKRTAPDDDTLQKIYINCNHPFGLFPLLLLCTGMRKSEALALTWEDIDLTNRIIHVTKALEYPDGNTAHVKMPKTSAGVRDIPIPDILMDHLHPGKGIVFKQEEYNGHPGGGYMSARAYESAWARYCRETGVRCTAHQLRHATATLLYEAGADEKVAQKILGHASPQTTRDIYTDLREAHIKAGADALNKALNDVRIHH